MPLPHLPVVIDDLPILDEVIDLYMADFQRWHAHGYDAAYIDFRANHAQRGQMQHGKRVQLEPLFPDRTHAFYEPCDWLIVLHFGTHLRMRAISLPTQLPAGIVRSLGGSC